MKLKNASIADQTQYFVPFEPAGNWVQLHIFNGYKLNYNTS
jgi:hypothetical protein